MPKWELSLGGLGMEWISNQHSTVDHIMLFVSFDPWTSQCKINLFTTKPPRLLWIVECIPFNLLFIFNLTQLWTLLFNIHSNFVQIKEYFTFNISFWNDALLFFALKVVNSFEETKTRSFLFNKTFVAVLKYIFKHYDFYFF